MLMLDVKLTLANTFGVVLVLAAYLWGGCVSCDQMFGSQQAMPGCCQHGMCDPMAHESSQQNAPSPDGHQHDQSCGHMPWMQAPSHDVTVQLAQHYASLPAAALTVASVLESAQRSNRLHHSPDPSGASPPDLPILHAALLI
jgi:hypothetical protein